MRTRTRSDEAQDKLSETVKEGVSNDGVGSDWQRGEKEHTNFEHENTEAHHTTMNAGSAGGGSGDNSDAQAGSGSRDCSSGSHGGGGIQAGTSSSSRPEKLTFAAPPSQSLSPCWMCVLWRRSDSAPNIGHQVCRRQEIA